MSVFNFTVSQPTKADPSYTIESLLLKQNRCTFFVNNYLKYFYDDINSGTIKVIVAPTDTAIQRLATATNKKLDELADLDLVVDILANHVSSQNLDSTSKIAYRAINGQDIHADKIINLKIVLNYGTLYGPYFLIVDNIIHMGTQLYQLKIYQIPSTLNNHSNDNNKTISQTMRNQIAGYDRLPADILRKIALTLNLVDISSICRVNKRFSLAICANDNFWNERIRLDFPNQARIPGMPFKLIYRILNGRAYTFGGNNKFKQLGVAVGRNQFDLNYAVAHGDLFSHPELLGVTMVVCHDKTTAIVADGSLYMAGVMLRMANAANNGFVKIATPPNVTWVAFTSDNEVILAEGRVYTRGINDSGQLGLPEVQGSITDFSLVANLTNVTSIACGSKHTAAVAEGRLYVWGNNSVGQLGLGDLINRVEPVLVPDLENVTMVEASRAQTMVIAGGRLYVVGNNIINTIQYPRYVGPDAYGILGLGANFDQLPYVGIFCLLPNLEEVAWVSCGEYHSAAISKGQLYTWGDNSRGQLGLINLQDDSKILYTNEPKLVSYLTNVGFVACGYDGIIAVTNGKMAIAGYPRLRILGNQDRIESATNEIPKESTRVFVVYPELEDVIMVGAGVDHFAALAI